MNSSKNIYKKIPSTYSSEVIVPSYLIKCRDNRRSNGTQGVANKMSNCIQCAPNNCADVSIARERDPAQY